MATDPITGRCQQSIFASDPSSPARDVLPVNSAANPDPPFAAAGPVASARAYWFVFLVPVIAESPLPVAELDVVSLDEQPVFTIAAYLFSTTEKQMSRSSVSSGEAVEFMGGLKVLLVALSPLPIVTVMEQF